MMHSILNRYPAIYENARGKMFKSVLEIKVEEYFLVAPKPRALYSLQTERSNNNRTLGVDCVRYSNTVEPKPNCVNVRIAFDFGTQSNNHKFTSLPARVEPPPPSPFFACHTLLAIKSRKIHEISS